jgi:hypothetical protein
MKRPTRRRSIPPTSALSRARNAHAGPWSAPARAARRVGLRRQYRGAQYGPRVRCWMACRRGDGPRTVASPWRTRRRPDASAPPRLPLRGPVVLRRSRLPGRRAQFPARLPHPAQGARAVLSRHCILRRLLAASPAARPRSSGRPLARAEHPMPAVFETRPACDAQALSGARRARRTGHDLQESLKP